MPLAPIRGAPPDAPIPDFPREVPNVETARPTASATTRPQQPLPTPRARHSPVEIRCDGGVLVFKVVPELPAISRARMVIQISADTVVGCSTDTIAAFEMSPAEAQQFLIELREARSPIFIRDGARGSMEIECEFTGTGLIFTHRDANRGIVLRRFSIDRTFDVRAMTNDLLADLGT